VKPRSQ
jgi:ATPase subunit of ABC transporter with duplicated ATPase domains